MPFDYPETPHVRKHGPGGYDQYKTYKDWLRDEFTFRCVYCLERERWDRSGHAAFGVDHVMPKGLPQYAALVCHYPNLLYACNRCNTAKKDRVLIDPCEEPFAAHLRIDEDGEIAGLTVEGRRVVNILGLDRRLATGVRREQIRIAALRQKYPDDPEVLELFLTRFGFPDDLPDLAAHSRATNSKPEGVSRSYLRMRESGTLPRTY